MGCLSNAFWGQAGKYIQQHVHETCFAMHTTGSVLRDNGIVITSDRIFDAIIKSLSYCVFYCHILNHPTQHSSAKMLWRLCSIILRFCFYADLSPFMTLTLNYELNLRCSPSLECSRSHVITLNSHRSFPTLFVCSPKAAFLWGFWITRAGRSKLTRPSASSLCYFVCVIV